MKNLKIIQKTGQNKTESFKTFNLYNKYDFIKKELGKDTLIDVDEIELILQHRFGEVENVGFILKTAGESLGIKSIRNFIISQDGGVVIGHEMLKIKNNLEEIKRVYKEYLDIEDGGEGSC